MDRKRGERRKRGGEGKGRVKKVREGWEEREISSRSLRFNLPRRDILREVNVSKGWVWWTLLRTVTTEVKQKHEILHLGEQSVSESFL